MDLQNWLSSNKMSQVVFAKKAHITRQTVRNLLEGISQPAFKTLMKIEKATKGAVTLHDWVNGK